jgi:uncharacterized membrane protein|tara:strand:- start:387 stop:881 length:495 start_codon:yes stop_codon:yes gene_type:complete
MKTQTIILVTSIFLTGLMAGIFFTWSNAVKPGIGKLNDIDYLSALQSMNRVILNSLFLIVFIGTIISVALVPVFHFHFYPKNIFWLLILIVIIYWVGVFSVTVFGNIPLNEILDKRNLSVMNPNDLSLLRDSIENRWNNFNLIRSISSALSFLLLIISYVLIDK